MARSWSIVLLLTLSLTGCGYRWLGTEQPVSATDRRLIVAPVVNRTTRAFLEQYGTAALVERFARSPRYELTEEPALAGAQLSAAIVDYRSRVAAYDRDDNISRYRLEVTVDATMRRLRDGRVLWKGRVQGGEDYSANPDRGHQQIDEEAAARALLERLADDLYTRLADDF